VRELRFSFHLVPASASLAAFAVVCLLAGCSTLPEQTPAPAPAPRELTIFSINDFHGNIQPKRPTPLMPRLPDAATGEVKPQAAGGVAYLATALDKLRGGRTDTVLVAAGDLIGAMLAAGLDRNAGRWANVVEEGSLGWALIALAAPSGEGVGQGAVESFVSDDNSPEQRKSAFLVAGLAGLGRLSESDANAVAGDLGVNITRQTRWSRAISDAANVGNPALVVLLAGLGMQGTSWEQMTPLHLYHITSALTRVGMTAEARMIAAEAVARG